jgi:hypothetical protein
LTRKNRTDLDHETIHYPESCEIEEVLLSLDEECAKHWQGFRYSHSYFHDMTPQEIILSLARANMNFSHDMIRMSKELENYRKAKK